MKQKSKHLKSARKKRRHIAPSALGLGLFNALAVAFSSALIETVIEFQQEEVPDKPLLEIEAPFTPYEEIKP